MQVTTDRIYLTKKGLKKLKKQVSKLARQRQQLEKSLRNMDKISTRDVSYERNELLTQIVNLEREIQEKEASLKRVQLLPTKSNPLEVVIGSVVELFDHSKREIVRYQIVDTIEADPSEGKISPDSPLGRELLGKKPSDQVEFTVGLKTKKFELCQIKV